jgi:hypothetical protein
LAPRSCSTASVAGAWRSRRRVGGIVSGKASSPGHGANGSSDNVARHGARETSHRGPRPALWYPPQCTRVRNQRLEVFSGCATASASTSGPPSGWRSSSRPFQVVDGDEPTGCVDAPAGSPTLRAPWQAKWVTLPDGRPGSAVSMGTNTLPTSSVLDRVLRRVAWVQSPRQAMSRRSEAPCGAA